MTDSISGLSTLLAGDAAAAGSSRNTSLADLESQLSAKKAELREAKSEVDKRAIQAQIDLIEKQIEELKARRAGNGDDSAQAKAAEEQAKLFRMDVKNFDPEAPFGNRVLYI